MTGFATVRNPSSFFILIVNHQVTRYSKKGRYDGKKLCRKVLPEPLTRSVQGREGCTEKVYTRTAAIENGMPCEVVQCVKS
jgi:hypothetical protein